MSNEQHVEEYKAKARPYRPLFHPKISFLDRIYVYFSQNMFLRLHQFQLYPNTCLRSFRLKLKLLSFAEKIETTLWNHSSGKNNKICKSSCGVPRKDDILSQWNILSKKKKISDVNSSSLETESNLVDITIHSSADFIQLKKKKNSLSSLKEQLSELPSSACIIVCFWGGGMTTKVDSGKGVTLARLIESKQRRSKKNSNGASSQNIILITPEYRLAPENPFPASVIDSLSILDFLIENVPKHVMINISGISAGGNLAAVSSLEVHRKHPGRIKSVYLWDPMLSPKCDSMSFYLNSRLGITTWAMWSWRAYLSLGSKDHLLGEKKGGKYVFYETYTDFLSYASNREVLKGSVLYQDNPEMRRLFEPISSIPDGLESSKAPKFIVSVSEGDPLHDDGLEFYDELKRKGAHAMIIKARCSHTMGMEFDNTFQERLIETWSNVMFSDQ